MNVFNDNNKLNHPAFCDEQVEKKQMGTRIFDFLCKIIVALGIVTWVLFCLWLYYFNERVEL